TNRIVATGYNGPPSGLRIRAAYAMCDFDCPRVNSGDDPHPYYEDCFSIHAEANALMFCDRRDREGGTIYVTGTICFSCAKLIANSGLKRVVMVDSADGHRPLEKTKNMLQDSQLELEIVQWME